jgi:hypothetical protein
MPGYRKVLDLLARRGIGLRIMCTTGGDLSSLLPPLIDAGINGLWISNIIGGIDATALGRDNMTIKRAVETTVPAALEEGHYLPCLDDRPRSNVPFSRYAYYRELLAEIARRR